MVTAVLSFSSEDSDVCDSPSMDSGGGVSPCTGPQVTEARGCSLIGSGLRPVTVPSFSPKELCGAWIESFCAVGSSFIRWLSSRAEGCSEVTGSDMERVASINECLTKYMRENMPDVTHYYDVWHVAKGFIRSIEKVSKECPEVKPWLKSISNHMYWCAASSHGQSPDVIVAKWQSLGNHIQNKHSNHGPLFPACLHDDPGTQTKPKKWLKPSTKGCEKVVDMINKTRVLRDVRKLSPGQQTSNVEAFHSLIIRFAPKSVHFSFLGMLTRLCLAAMHYNENAGRKQAKNRDGELVFIIRYPKFKNGGYTLQAKKVHPTFGQISCL
ncbi:uncharacterized protein KZ484_024496 [Pholidichthys leucotaenia]